jgi:endonuclease YncB( thermonuclease family)
MARFSKHPDSFDATLHHAADGDTIIAIVELPFDVYVKRSVRLAGVDSWELDSPEQHKAQRAARWIEELIGSTPIVITPTRASFDLHGRILARVLTERGDLAQLLIENGLAWPRAAAAPEIFAPRCPPSRDLTEAR